MDRKANAEEGRNLLARGRDELKKKKSRERKKGNQK